MTGTGTSPAPVRKKLFENYAPRQNAKVQLEPFLYLGTVSLRYTKC